MENEPKEVGGGQPLPPPRVPKERSGEEGTADERIEADSDIRIDADIKLFIQAALSDYMKYIPDTTSDIGALITHAIGWNLMTIDNIVYSDQVKDLSLESSRSTVERNILEFSRKIFAKMPDVVDRFDSTLKDIIDKCFGKAGALAGSNIGKTEISVDALYELRPLIFAPEDWKDADEGATKVRHKKFRDLRNSVYAELIISTPNLPESSPARGALIRMLKQIRALLLALYASSLAKHSRYHVQESVFGYDKIPIMPEMENRKTQLFELLSLVTNGDKYFSQRLGKYTNEAFSFYFGYYAACIRRGISARGNVVNVDDLVISNVFLVLHLFYVMTSDPIVQTTLTPAPMDIVSRSDEKPAESVQFDNWQGTANKTESVFQHFCKNTANSARLYANMVNEWIMKLANVSFQTKGVNSFLSYGRFRKHHAKILRQASRDVFQRSFEQRIVNMPADKIVDNEPGLNPEELKQFWETLPAHAKYVNYDESKQKVIIPRGEFVGIIGGETQRHLEEESAENFIRTLDESINIFDIERTCQFLADRMSGVFDLSKKSTRDTIEAEFEVAGDMGLRKFSAILEERFQFTRDDFVTGPKRDLLSFLNIVNDREFVGEMLEGILSSNSRSWNYLDTETNEKMRLFAVVMCGAPLHIYSEFKDAEASGVTYDMDYHKVMYMLNSVVAINANAQGMKNGNSGLPANTQVETLYFIEQWSKRASADKELQYNSNDTPTQKLRKIVLFLNLLAVALVRNDSKKAALGEDDPLDDGTAHTAKVQFSTDRQTDRMTFGSYMVRRLLLKWLARNIIRLMGFCPSNEKDTFAADSALHIIAGSGSLFNPLYRDLVDSSSVRKLIPHVVEYLPEESIGGVTVGFVESFGMVDFDEEYTEDTGVS